MSSVSTKFIRVNKSQSYVFKKSVNCSVSIIFFSSCSRRFLLNYNKMYKMQAHSAFFAVEGSDLSAKYVDKQKCPLISNSNNFNVCLHSYQIKKKFIFYIYITRLKTWRRVCLMFSNMNIKNIRKVINIRILTYCQKSKERGGGGRDYLHLVFISWHVGFPYCHARYRLHQQTNT